MQPSNTSLLSGRRQLLATTSAPSSLLSHYLNMEYSFCPLLVILGKIVNQSYYKPDKPEGEVVGQDDVQKPDENLLKAD